MNSSLQQIGMKNKLLTYILLLGCFQLFPTQIFGQKQTNTPEKKAIQDLIERVVPKQANHFKIEFIPQENGNDVFELESVKGKILLRGNNGISIASALNYYLKNVAHCQITWNDANLNFPEKMPTVPSLVRKITPYQYRYYLNFSTFNYSMSWWNWDRWQKEIDLMALNGINMPLAITGQNTVWQRVFNKLGISNDELNPFFAGPAYSSWFWMGNLKSWGGPVSQQVMEEQEMLQKKILQEERLLGMTPILPAFNGHVPQAFANKFPNTKISRIKWNGFDYTCLLDPNDPLFTEIGKSFIEEQTKVYGTDHLYAAEIFNSKPTFNDTTHLANLGKKYYQSLQMADPKAIWIMQSRAFRNDADFWGEAQISAFLNSLSDSQLIILDDQADLDPMWKKTNLFQGKPYLWCMMQNQGRNIGMTGSMERVARKPGEKPGDQESGKKIGIGLSMEGLEQNPVMFELMTENVWNEGALNLSSFLKDYSRRRYGQKNGHAEMGWKLLSKSVYADTITCRDKSIVTSRPALRKKSDLKDQPVLAYDPNKLVEAWRFMMISSVELTNSDGFQYDLADITRQVLSDYAYILYQQIIEDYLSRNAKDYEKNSQKFIALLKDMDELLASRKEFLLGCWLESAKNCGSNKAEKLLFERNARNLITLWGDKDSKLHDYANKQWSGMINGFYVKRWEKFNETMMDCILNHRNFNEKKMEEELKTLEWEWINSHETYPTKPKGEAIVLSTKLFRKYYDQIEKAYRN